MNWPPMTKEELHTFGIAVVVRSLEKEGIFIEGVNTDLKLDPQIVAIRMGTLAYIAVRTDCYPNRGILTQPERQEIIQWAGQKHAIAFFASVGILCARYPDKSIVTSESDKGLPIRDGGFYVVYEGLRPMSTSDHVLGANEII
jgi:hypothetical protein